MSWGSCIRCHRTDIEKKEGPPGVFAVIVCPDCGVVEYQVVYGHEYIEGRPGEGVFARAYRILHGG